MRPELDAHYVGRPLKSLSLPLLTTGHALGPLQGHMPPPAASCPYVAPKLSLAPQPAYTTLKEASRRKRQRTDVGEVTTQGDESDLERDRIENEIQPNDDQTSTPTAFTFKMPLIVYVYPDPFSMVDLPADEELNPYIQTSQRGEMEHTPAGNATPFTRSVFPRVVIPYKLLVANLDVHIVKKIEESPPDTYLAVSSLSSLGIGANPELTIARAVPRGKIDQKRDFERPWAMVLEGASDELKEFLIWQQTFAVSRDLAFSVVPFDKDLKSWVIMNISGDVVQPGEAAMHKALGGIKKVLWHDLRFRAIADKFCATKPFNLTYIESDNAQGTHAPIWQLTGRPLSSNPDVQEAFLNNVRNHRYWVGIHMLVIDQRLVNCVWCKSDTHPAHACPFPKVNDWLSPASTAASKALAQIDGSSARGRGRGRGRGNGRGRGGRGNPGRGGAGQDGWKTVTHRR
ncbi:hypothetical protein FPV67DRAFT_1674377 [Lyophyllum atratum]|nr:hypothetical protein FPV67DRAFT_1674377 [Lyophyllum atratum]